MELKEDSYHHGTSRGSCSPQESMLDFMTVVISIVQVLFTIAFLTNLYIYNSTNDIVLILINDIY